jgi:hypothetical protein
MEFITRLDRFTRRELLLLPERDLAEMMESRN